jgi:hypothetical protein
MRKSLWLAAFALAGFSQVQAGGFPVTFQVPLQIREIPSDIDNINVMCTIDAPSKHWESSSPVHLGGGRFDGTVAVLFSLPEPLPYDASWRCKLRWGDKSVNDIATDRHRATVLRAFDAHGTFR